MQGVVDSPMQHGLSLRRLQTGGSTRKYCFRSRQNLLAHCKFHSGRPETSSPFSRCPATRGCTWLCQRFACMEVGSPDRTTALAGASAAVLWMDASTRNRPSCAFFRTLGRELRQKDINKSKGCFADGQSAGSSAASIALRQASAGLIVDAWMVMAIYQHHMADRRTT